MKRRYDLNNLFLMNRSIAPDGILLGTVETGQPTSNVAWGEDGQTLFMAGGSSIYRFRLTTSGARY